MQIMEISVLEDDKLFNFDGPEDDNNEYDDDLEIEGIDQFDDEEKFDDDDF